MQQPVAVANSDESKQFHYKAWPAFVPPRDADVISP